MSISIFKKSAANKEQLDVSSTHNLWGLLRARYNSIEATQMLKNFVHDEDLDILLEMFLKHFQTQTEQLEQEAKKHKVKVPVRPVIDIKTSTHIDEITDKFIYKRVNADMLAEMFSLKVSFLSLRSRHKNLMKVLPIIRVILYLDKQIHYRARGGEWCSKLCYCPH